MSKADDPRLSTDEAERRWAETWYRRLRIKKRMERQGCIFKKMQTIDNHEIDVRKDCICGRPNRVDK